VLGTMHAINHYTIDSIRQDPIQKNSEEVRLWGGKKRRIPWPARNAEIESVAVCPLELRSQT
jgi:hypothetical protein